MRCADHFYYIIQIFELEVSIKGTKQRSALSPDEMTATVAEAAASGASPARAAPFAQLYRSRCPHTREAGAALVSNQPGAPG